MLVEGQKSLVHLRIAGKLGGMVLGLVAAREPGRGRLKFPPSSKSFGTFITRIVFAMTNQGLASVNGWHSPSRTPGPIPRVGKFRVGELPIKQPVRSRTLEQSYAFYAKSLVRGTARINRRGRCKKSGGTKCCEAWLGPRVGCVPLETVCDEGHRSLLITDQKSERICGRCVEGTSTK